MDGQRKLFFYIYFFFNLLISAGYQDKCLEIILNHNCFELILNGNRFFQFLFLSL